MTAGNSPKDLVARLSLPVLGKAAERTPDAGGKSVRLDVKAIQPLIDALPFYVLLVDRHHNIAAANRALGEVLAMEPDRMRGRFCPQLIHGREDSYPGCPLADAVDRQVPTTSELSGEHGECFESAMFPSSYVGEDREPLYLHFVSNVTEQREASNALARSAEHQAAVIRLLERVPACQTPQDLLREVIEQVVAISWMDLKARAAGFILRGDTLQMVHQHRLAEPLLDRCGRIALGQCLCGRVAASRKPIVCSELTEEHDIRHPGMLDHGHVVLPLYSGEKTLGVLNFYLESGKPLDPYRLQFLELVASITAEALSRINLRAKLVLVDRMATVGALAAGVAHEIRNPLTYLLYNLESLTAELTDVARAIGSVPPNAVEQTVDARLPSRQIDWEDLASRAEDALEGAARIRDIVSDLNVFSHRGESHTATVAVSDVLESALRLALNEVKHRAVIDKHFRSVPPVSVSPGRLGQVFLNLIINAAHAFEDGNPRRNVLTLAVWQEGDNVCTEVADNGRGIEPENVARVFEPFFTTKPSGVGTGLGLSICQEIVSKMDGRIDVSSELGVGTRFVVRIPRAQGEADAARAKQSSHPVASQSGARILIIDDEPIVRSALMRMLGDEYRTVLASSGETAKRILERDAEFDVVVSDVMMQDGDGMDLHAWLTTHHPQLARRTIFVTGGASAPTARRFLENVPNPKLEKPVRARDLRFEVRRLLQDA